MSADASPNGTVAGAVETVLPDPLMGAGTFFAGSTNGGIWKTTNGGKTWSALTDNQASLSIGSLSLDPSDPTGKTIIAGIGITDNGGYSPPFTVRGRGGERTGFLYSTDGGNSWSVLGGNKLAGESVVSAMARGNTMLAATFEQEAPGADSTNYGLFRSTNGGANFTKLSGNGVSGLPAGAVTSLVADPNDTKTFYAAVKDSTSKAATSVYISRDTGATWTQVFSSANTNLISATGDPTTITLAAGPNHSVAIALSDLGHAKTATQPAVSASLAGVFLSSNNGTSWNQLNAPNVVAGLGQTPINLHIAIDPTNKNIVYLAGDSPPPCGCSGAEVVRIKYDPNDGSSKPTSLTFAGTAVNNFQDANTVHSDSRSITFDQAGNLILSNDGGIYLRTNPKGAGTWEGGTGSWSGLNGNLAVLEAYSIAYDANTKRVAIAAQDNGTSLQTAPGSTTFTTINGGDGTNVAINDRMLNGQSAIYSTSADLGGLSRLIVNAQGQVVSPGYDPVNAPGGVPVVCTYASYTRTSCDTVVGAAQTNTFGGAFSAQFVLNKQIPSMIAITGKGDVFVTQDSLNVGAKTVNLTLTDLGSTIGTPLVVTYGTQNNRNAIAVGVDDGSIWLSQSNTAGSLSPLTNYSGGAPTGIVFDQRLAARLFAADGTNLWYSTNATGAGDFLKLFVPDALGFSRPTSVEFISNNGVNALLAGGVNLPLTCTPAPNGCVILNTQSPITVFDSDSLGGLSSPRAFGQGLPNAIVYQMVYNPTVDVLAVSSIGRGAYVLYDVTSYFAQATQLQFGLANNDSMPDASYLTDGTTGGRPLYKYGTGTLTIAGTATYSGGTFIDAGMMMLGNGGTGGSVTGNITFCSDVVADPHCDPSTNKMLGFNRSDVFTYNGTISGPGQVLQLGRGTTVMGGASTYSGPTMVEAGTLQAGGANVFSPNSAYTVFGGAALDLAGFNQLVGGLFGTGPVINSGGVVPTLTVAFGGTFAPGSGTAGSSMAIAGNLAFQSGAFYLVQVGANTASFASVAGTAAPGGATVQAVLTGGSISKQPYVILTAAGGVLNTFAGVAGLPATVPGTLSYDASNVFLNLSVNYNLLGGLNANQQNVGNALSNFFNSNGSIPLTFATLSPASLSQIAGEAATGSQQTTFQAMSQFITTLLDPFIGGRSGTAPGTTAAPYAEEDSSASAYAASGKTRSERERAAYATVYNKAPLRQVYDPHWSVWAAPFGGAQTTDGNAATGSNSATSNIFGVAAGADYLLSPRTIAGFALAGGGTSFGVTNFGGGRSDLFQAGGYVRHNAGAAYVAGALAYGWQDVTTDRMVMADKLHAEFNANALSGRIEGGYRFATKWFGLTPYAAGQFTTFFLPAYAEQAVFGSSTFALAYGARNVTDARTELGIRTDRSFALATGLLTLRGRFAWAHDFDPDRAIAATFQALPGASFVVNGAAQASESALTTASAEMKWRNGWSAAATFEGEFSKVTASYAGKGLVRYAW